MRQVVLQSIKLALTIVALCNSSLGFTPVAVSTCRRLALKHKGASCDAFIVPSSVQRQKENNLSMATNHHDNNETPNQCVARCHGRMIKLRKRCQTIASAAIVALAVQRIGVRPVYASTPPAEVVAPMDLSSIIEEAQPSPSTTATATAAPTPHVTISLQDFEKIRSEQSAQRPQALSPAAKRQQQIASRNRARSGQYSQTATSTIIKQFVPAGVGGFFLVQFIRMKIRLDREKAYVQDNIEKMEVQKREYFNVTGQALSDDDLMESLAKATGNITLEEVDEEDEDEDEGEAVKRPPSTPKSPKTPSSSGGGTKGSSGESGGKSSSGKGDSSSPSASSTSDKGPASDEDIERTKRLFDK